MTASSLHESLHALLFHVAAALDVNDGQLGFIDATQLGREAYLKILCFAVAQETVELDGGLSSFEENLHAIPGMFHKQAENSLKQNGRQELSKTIQFWKE